MKRLPTVMALLALVTTAQAQWTQTSGPTGIQIASMATDGHAVVANTSRMELARYNDGAWHFIDSISAHRVFGAPNVLLINDLTSMRLLRSVDGGEVWMPTELNGIIWDISDNGTDIFVTVGKDIYRSTNRGESWAKTGRIDARYINTLLATGAGLLAHAGNEHGDDMLQYSADNGATWKTTGAGIPQGGTITSWASAGDTVIASFYYHGIYISTDGGNNWAVVNNGILRDKVWGYGRSSVAIIGGEPWLATPRGVYRFKAGVWRHASPEPGSFLAAYGRITGSPGVLMGADAGLFEGTLKDDAGTVQWTPLSNELKRHDVVALARSSDAILAATPGGLYRSVDNGDSWMRVLLYPTKTLGGAGDAVMAITGEGGPSIYRSVDGGITWTDSVQGIAVPGTSVNTLASADGYLYLGAGDGFRVGTSDAWSNAALLRSGDSGATWSAADNGLPVVQGEKVPIFKLLASGHTVVAITSDGLYYSPDRGENWSKGNVDLTGPSWTNHLAVWNDTMYMASDFTIYRSTDGINWGSPIGSFDNESLILGLDVIDGIPLITVSSPDHQTQEMVYRVYKYVGGTWTYLEHLPPDIRVFKFIRSGDNVLAGTSKQSVWRAPLSAVGDGQSSVERPRAGAWSLTSAPNPFCDETSIRFTTSGSRYATVSVLDPLGHEVLSVFKGRLDAGEHQFRVDGGGLASGMYFYRVEIDGKASVGRIVKTH